MTDVLPPATVALGLAEARAMAVRAQLLGDAAPSDAQHLVTMLGAVQIDSISVGARSHALVMAARGIPPDQHDAYFGGGGATFEYWAHASCVLPVETWPAMAFRRRRMRDKVREWGTDEALCQTILGRLREEGPLTVADLREETQAPRSGGWDWSRVKEAFESLLFAGSITCARRDRWRRVYDLPERVIPADSLTDGWTDRECVVHLVARAGAALGVATLDDLADYYRLRPAVAAEVLEEAGLLPVTVEGWPDPAFASPDALSASRPTGSVTALLSPFDSMVWHRPRVQRLFGIDYVFEAYKRAHQRRYGYYVMPLLHDSEILELVDLRTEAGTCHARAVLGTDARATDALKQALTRLLPTLKANSFDTSP